ncbi:hypothetical protein [Lacticaseibacillus paracasei]|uniref:hypothetical protein n=1 Tax=Lacticaseibacillus paracasei TaxID=1597 RepID=UPI004045FC06
MGSKRRLHSSSASPAPSDRRLRSLARQESISLAPSYDYSEFNDSQVRRGNYGSASFLWMRAETLRNKQSWKLVLASTHHR